MLSKYGLESKNYHDSDENTNWEKCSIRKWLNNDFYEESFNDYEKSNVEFVKINYYDTLKSEIAFTTEDGVFLLSSDEFNTYKNRFKENIKCEPTERVKLQRNVDKDRKDFYYWRLRSQGTSVSDKDNKAVDENGDINQDYYYNAFYPDSTLNKGLIRPAIWVKFE